MSRAGEVFDEEHLARAAPMTRASLAPEHSEPVQQCSARWLDN
jgi:hypothetical protein